MEKFICIMLAIVLCTACFISCGKDIGEQSQASQEQSIPSAESVPDEESVESVVSEEPNIIIKDFGNETITFLVIDNDISEIMPNELGEGNSNTWMTEGVNDAIKARNELTEKLLNVQIKELKVASGRVGDKFLTYIRNEINGSAQSFEICVPSIYDCGTLASEDSFYNLKTVESLNLTNSWWDHSFNESMTINDNLYFTLGDIGLVNKNATPVVYFNKNLCEDNGITSAYLYQLVKDKKWTFDKAYEFAKLLSADVNDDKKIDYHDHVGWAGQADDTWNFFFASGERIASRNADNKLALSMYNTRSVNVAEKMYEMFRDDLHYISANDYFGDSGEPTVQCTGAAFIEGRVMFFSDNMAFMHLFSQMENNDFGVLPTPKYDELQDNYHSLINPWTGNAFAIPISLDSERAYFAGAVLDAMGYYSKDTVAYEYVQKTLMYQKTRDDGSIDMLNLIFDTRGCDFGIIYNIGKSSGTSLPSMLQNIMSSPAGTFASQYDSIKDAAQSDLEEILQLYE